MQLFIVRPLDKDLVLSFWFGASIYVTDLSLQAIAIFELLTETNIYVDSQAPWSLRKTDPYRMNTVLFVISNIIIKSSIMLLPVIPTSAKKVIDIFNIDISYVKFDNFDILFEKDIYISDPKPIFPRII